MLYSEDLNYFARLFRIYAILNHENIYKLKNRKNSMREIKSLKKKLIPELIIDRNITDTKKNLEKQKNIELVDQRIAVIQKLSFHSIQRHLSLLKFEEMLLIITFITAGVLGRILLQGLPSVEPITFFAILAGSLFGWKKGFFTGASSWYLSNFFVLGGHGPWTIVHSANGAIAGLLGGVFLQKPTYVKTVAIMAITTIIFEISINLMSGLLFYGILISFLTAIPFTLVHITSNIAFSFLLPKTRKTIYEKGRLNEKEICKQLIEKITFQKKNDENKIRGVV